MKNIKRLLSVVVCVVLIFTAVPFLGGITANADGVYTEGFYTYTVSGGKAVITKCDDSISGNITVPSDLGGYPVVSIVSEAFAYCFNLEGITIPKSVTNIDAFSFIGSLNLSYIEVDGNNSCYSSENGVLYNKNRTELICFPAGKAETFFSVPNTVTSIGGGAFACCLNLTEIEMHNNITDIGMIAFGYCVGLTDVTLPSNITAVNYGLFGYCTNLASIEIPSKVTNIGGWAFEGCENLKSVSFSNNVEVIGDGAFSYCESLERVSFYGGYSDWNNIGINGMNESLLNAARYYSVADLNGDGNVNATDIIIMKKVLFAMPDGNSDIYGAVENCDVNGDSEINILDFIQLKEMLLAY